MVLLSSATGAPNAVVSLLMERAFDGRSWVDRTPTDKGSLSAVNGKFARHLRQWLGVRIGKNGEPVGQARNCCRVSQRKRLTRQ